MGSYNPSIIQKVNPYFGQRYSAPRLETPCAQLRFEDFGVLGFRAGVLLRDSVLSYYNKEALLLIFRSPLNPVKTEPSEWNTYRAEGTLLGSEDFWVSGFRVKGLRTLGL